MWWIGWAGMSKKREWECDVVPLPAQNLNVINRSTIRVIATGAGCNDIEKRQRER
jgi:hypothetical protein